MSSVKNGYMSVEAAFVVPWAVFIIVWLIYLGFFEYDRCLIFQDNYSLATQAASRIDTTNGKQNWLDSHKRGWLGSKYMATRSVTCQGTVSSGRITLCSSLNVSQPFRRNAGMIPASNWSISDEVNADNFSYTKRLRLFRAGMRLAGGAAP